MIKVERPTEGPDILLSANDKTILLFDEVDKSGFTHGVCKKWQLDLSVEDARKLRDELSIKIDYCMQMKNS